MLASGECADPVLLRILYASGRQVRNDRRRCRRAQDSSKTRKVRIAMSIIEFPSSGRTLLLIAAGTCFCALLMFTGTPLSGHAAEKDRAKHIPLRADPDEPRGAEDFGSEENVPHIPEPMVFDLVRGLGAQKGEMEVNVLARFPTRNDDPHGIQWAPEIEGAVADGIALEFELPFEDSHLEAYKFAAQFTIGTPIEDHFIHGAQVIIEKLAHEEIWETSALYIPGYRFNSDFSMLSMIGFRNASGADIESDTEFLFNFSIFADLGPGSSFGVESNYESGLDGKAATWLLMPQLHIEVVDKFMIQIGGGFRLNDGDTFPEVATRWIYSWR